MEPDEDRTWGDLIPQSRMARLMAEEIRTYPSRVRRQRRWVLVQLVGGLSFSGLMAFVSLASYEAAKTSVVVNAYADPAGHGEASYYVLWGPALLGLLITGRAAMLLYRTRHQR